MPSRQQVLSLAAACLSLGLTSCGTSSHQDGTVGSSALCSAVLLIDGVTYNGIGGLVRDPPVTGEEVGAVMPGCNDTGGEPPPEQAVSAQVLSDVDSATALFYEGAVYVREGREAPERLTYWRTAPACATAGTFELSGAWLGVKSPQEPEHSGDIQLPYRAFMHVDVGPERYTRAQITVHASTSTSPALGADEVTSSLWEGGTVTAQVRCDGDRFEAIAMSAEGP